MLTAVPFTSVTIADSFWAPRREANRKVSLRHSLEMLKQSGTIKNFETAAKGLRSGFIGPVFMDSDLYKTIEAVSYSLATDPDPELDREIDVLVDKIAAAQMPDGYLDTYYEVNAPDRRFTNLEDNHEMYCQGHLIEAAVAHFQATGKTKLLNVAKKVADHLCQTFGSGPGHRMGYCGHPEIELALVKLSRATGERKYFDLATFFIENRGSHFFAQEHKVADSQYDGTYWLDRVPISKLDAMEGHAVRAGYLLSGATDVAGETGNADLLGALQRIWKNTTGKRTFITGGIGASGSNEGFTTDYDLPNETAYQETCASVAMAMWNYRMALVFGDSKYADSMERALYNGVLAGVSLDGQNFFYGNPLASRGGYQRAGWFGCACCPPNEARTLAALGGYAYASSPDSLYVNLYIQGKVNAKVGDRAVGLDVKTEYPWDGKVAITVNPQQPARFAVRLRKPGWCRGATVKVNGVGSVVPVARGYFVVDRAWNAGDKIELDLPMPVDRVAANPNVKQDLGRLALTRGPLVYCLESVDQKANLSSTFLPEQAPISATKRADLLGGVVELQGTGMLNGDRAWPGGLYSAATPPSPTEIVAIPYYAWANRGADEMEVWIPTSPPAQKIVGLEGKATVSASFVSSYAKPNGVNDGSEPQSSSEQAAALMHWWPHKGTSEWVQYSWATPQTVAGSRVYWFDDTGAGECCYPTSAKIQYLDGEVWRDVEATGKLATTGNQWCDISFKPVATKSLRLILQLQKGWSAGVRQWRVTAPDGG